MIIRLLIIAVVFLIIVINASNTDDDIRKAIWVVGGSINLFYLYGWWLSSF